jgi:hypothetical protein
VVKSGVVDISEIDEEVTDDRETEDEMAEEDIEVGGKGISSGLMYSENAGRLSKGRVMDVIPILIL